MNLMKLNIQIILKKLKRDSINHLFFLFNQDLNLFLPNFIQLKNLIKMDEKIIPIIKEYNEEEKDKTLGK
jgi:hypothetical protein